MRATAALRPLVRGPSFTRAAAVIACGLTAVTVALVIAVGVGTVDVAPDVTVRVIAHRLFGLPAAGWSASAEQIVVDLRLPRALAALVVGGALGAAGTVFQAVLRNPMADPYVIGTAAGASLGAVVGILLPSLVPGLALTLAAGSWLGIGITQMLAFVGALATVLLVYSVARHGGRVPIVTLLLAGYAVSAVLAALVALLMFTSGRALAAVVAWLMGSLAGSSWSQLAFALPIVAVAFAMLIVRWRTLNLLLLGETHAAHLGVDVEREKLTLTVLATLITSAAVAISGTIGFVGLVVPHVLRLAIGPDHRLLLPGSVLFGAALLAVADVAARVAGGVPVGVLTALIGVPFFLWLLRRGASLEPAG